MANSIKIGNDNTIIKLGNDDVTIYLGDTLVYSGGTPPTPTFSGKWLASYSDSSTSSADCDSTSAITYGDITLTNLVSVVIGDCVTSIGEYTFNGCRSLTSIDIPSGVTSIGDYAFKDCRSLTSIVIPDSVTSIGESAFESCTGITTCTIGSGVTSIGYGAFNRCSGLTNITVNATTPPTLASGVFNNTNNCPIYVPANSVNAYKTANKWSSYASRIQAIPNS